MSISLHLKCEICDFKVFFPIYCFWRIWCLSHYVIYGNGKAILLKCVQCSYMCISLHATFWKYYTLLPESCCTSFITQERWQALCIELGWERRKCLLLQDKVEAITGTFILILCKWSSSDNPSTVWLVSSYTWQFMGVCCTKRLLPASVMSSLVT